MWRLPPNRSQERCFRSREQDQPVRRGRDPGSSGPGADRLPNVGSPSARNWWSYDADPSSYYADRSSYDADLSWSADRSSYDADLSSYDADLSSYDADRSWFDADPWIGADWLLNADP